MDIGIAMGRLGNFVTVKRHMFMGVGSSIGGGLDGLMSQMGMCFSMPLGIVRIAVQLTILVMAVDQRALAAVAADVFDGHPRVKYKKIVKFDLEN